jgi:hypothetical protein
MSTFPVQPSLGDFSSVSYMKGYDSRIYHKKEHLQREETFLKQKEEMVSAQQQQKLQKELEECTFEPLTYESLRNPNNQRDLDGFLDD